MMETTFKMIEESLDPEVKKVLDGVYCDLESEAVLTVLGYLDFRNLGKPVRDSPELSDIVAGVFLEPAHWICCKFDKNSGEYPINYARFLGEKIVKKMEVCGIISDVQVPGDDYESWFGYVLTDKGRRYVEAYKKQDWEILKKLSEGLFQDK